MGLIPLRPQTLKQDTVQRLTCGIHQHSVGGWFKGLHGIGP